MIPIISFHCFHFFSSKFLKEKIFMRMTSEVEV